MSENRVLRIREWYEACGTPMRAHVRDAYLQKFKPKNPSSFYQAVANRNLALDKILFFAELFECTVDDLLLMPGMPKLEPIRPDDRKAILRRAKFDQKELHFQS